MSRLSKYVKEKIVKVLVAALVVGTVAGNGTLTVQAEEAATVVGEESVSGGDAVVKENVVADPEVTPEATTMVTPDDQYVRLGIPVRAVWLRRSGFRSVDADSFHVRVWYGVRLLQHFRFVVC